MASILKRAVNKARRIAVRKTARFRSPLRAAVVGAGAIAPDHILPYQDSGLAQVVGISDLRPTALADALDLCSTARGYLDAKRMLAERRPDVVSICTWPQSHAELVRAAADAGVRGILCEKPLALTMAEVDEMVAICRDKGIKLAGGHQYRFHSNFTRAAEAVRSGSLGRIVSAVGSIKSTIANNGPHLIDTARFVLGDPPAVSATCRCVRERNEFNRGFPAEDGAEGRIDFGAFALEIRTGDLSDEFFAIEVVGEKGRLRVTPTDLEITEGSSVRRFASDDRYRARQFTRFLRWVKGRDADYPADAESSARTNELVLALYEAARIGGPVTLPLAAKGDVVRALYPTAPEAADAVPPAEEPRPDARGVGDARLAMHGGARTVTGWFSTAPSIGTAELKGVARVVLSKRLCSTDGTVVKAFEREIAELYGARSAVASTSGTAAIHVGVASLGLNPGDEIVTTPLTDMGSVIPILACNCLPVFADVDPRTGNLTAETIAAKLTPRTKAVVLVHLFGRPADMGPILDLLRPRGVALVEDCSQAHFADYKGRKVGTWGDVGCFSLQGTKQITCGDGGYTLINRPELAYRASLFVDKGWDRTKGVRSHLFLGMNYRMTELQGAVARVQAKRLPGLVAARRRTADLLSAKLAQIPGILPPPNQDGIVSSWWTYPFTIDEREIGVDVAAFLEAVRVEGAKVRAHYLPAPIFDYDMLKHQRTYGDSRYPFSAFPYEAPRAADFPGFAEFNRTQMFTPWSQHATDANVEQIARAVRKVADHFRDARSASRGRAEAGVVVGA